MLIPPCQWGALLFKIIHSTHAPQWARPAGRSVSVSLREVVKVKVTLTTREGLLDGWKPKESKVAAERWMTASLWRRDTESGMIGFSNTLWCKWKLWEKCRQPSNYCFQLEVLLAIYNSLITVSNDLSQHEQPLQGVDYIPLQTTHSLSATLTDKETNYLHMHYHYPVTM